MLIGVNPSETVWWTWTAIQRERIRLDRDAATEKRVDLEGRLAARSEIGEEARAAALKPFDDLLARLSKQAAAADEEASSGEPEFQVGHISWNTRGRVRALYTTGRVEDAVEAVALLVRHGCRGHRNFRDAAGGEIPFGFSESKGNFPVLDEATFEAYAASGVAEALATVILDYNVAGQERRKN